LEKVVLLPLIAVKKTLLGYFIYRSSAADTVFNFFKNFKALLVYRSKWISIKELTFRRPDKGLMSLINIKPMALISSALLRLYYNILSPTFVSLGSV